MKLFLKRLVLMILLASYMYFIWWQSSNFDPETVFALTSKIHPFIFLAIGACLELAHLFEFGILYLLFILLFLSYGPLNRKKQVVAVILSLLYGLVDEIHQQYVPYRTASFSDLLKNSLGVLVIWWSVHKSYYERKFKRLSSILRSVEKPLSIKK